RRRERRRCGVGVRRNRSPRSLAAAQWRSLLRWDTVAELVSVSGRPVGQLRERLEQAAAERRQLVGACWISSDQAIVLERVQRLRHDLARETDERAPELVEAARSFRQRIEKVNAPLPLA